MTSPHNNQQKLNFPSDVAKWFDSEARAFFQQLKLEKNDTILDFGSRVGNYAIPAAMFVGPDGKVYALDVDAGALDELVRRARFYELKNIETILTTGEVTIPLGDNSVDFILFFDVLYSLCRRQGVQAYTELLKEFHRVLKPKGRLAIFFGHYRELNLTLEELLDMSKAFFRYNGVFTAKMLHWDSFAHEKVHHFTKE